LILAWGLMALRLGGVAVAQTAAQVIAIQALDGASNAMFAVVAAAWVTDRLGDYRRFGEAQVIVGSCLVLGSAIGPAVSGYLVEALGYRGLFAALAGAGAIATAIVVFGVPETVATHRNERVRKPQDLVAAEAELA
jgi:MFS family permease